jgi:hypothetical protein
VAGVLHLPDLGRSLPGRAEADKTTPHTAVVEIKGEIASGADASAEFVVAAMKRPSRTRAPRAWCC